MNVGDARALRQMDAEVREMDVGRLGEVYIVYIRVCIYIYIYNIII